MNFNIYNSLILVGTIQGFVFALIVLLHKKYKSKSTYFLMALIVSVSLNNLQYYLRDTNLICGTDLMKYLYIPYASLNPVLLYFYVHTFLSPKKIFSKGEKLLFLPFVIFFSIFLILKGMALYGLDDRVIAEVFWTISNFHELFSILFSLLLLVVLFKTVLKFEKSQEDSKPKSFQLKITWLKVLLVFLFIILGFYTYLMGKVILLPDLEVSFYLLWISNSFIIYILGHIGIYKYGIMMERKKIRLSSINTFSVSESNAGIEHLDALKRLVEGEKLYLDPTISLEKISEELNISCGHLSRIINTGMSLSFTEYINRLRVEEAKTYLTNPEFAKYTLVAIGLEAGFNSKSAFHACFKKYTNLTPHQFKIKTV